MKLRLRVLTLSLAASLAPAALASPRQDHAAIRQAVETFLRAQTAGLPGQVSVHTGALDARLSLPACAGLEPFLTNGSRLMGGVTVGVRCNAPAPWTVYVPATIKVMTDIVVSARPLAHGETISPADLTVQKGDLGQLPAGVLTEPGQAVGKTVTISIMSGQPLRSELLRSAPVVLAGQTVKLVSRGPGFQVSSEGKALASATAGQVAQVRVTSGQVISGIARAGSIVEVSF